MKLLSCFIDTVHISRVDDKNETLSSGFNLDKVIIIIKLDGNMRSIFEIEAFECKLYVNALKA
ncbi:hypothetical protein BpHYR1_026751 [Brachionus plicatilis]|uniref:Uncharacterized protein n=1 Tax=Brachionus plicatilis TaxID=10195 RepID=A0A3M7R224_BRAPC|nr:hypothetical protein BpHYR1_026751 [Brachionus plicatilis]